MKSVVLVNPPLQLEDRYGKDMKHFGGISEPLGIAYIAGYLELLNIPVRIIDAQAENLIIDLVVENIASHKDSIVGITMLTPMHGVVKQLCLRLKEKYPECLIVLGGAHCTALPEKTLQEIPDADIVCIGEGEFTMSGIVTANNSDFEKIKGICFCNKGKLIKTTPRPFIKDLDKIPYPARHLLPMEKYHLTVSRVVGSGYCPTIIVARGCPYSCTYCSHPFGMTFRTHSITRIIKEIQYLIATYRISQINIEADTLTVNKKFLLDICSAIINTGINRKIRWTCESRVNTINEEILRLMKKAGCWQISYGVETGSQRLLDLIHKSVTLEQIEDAFHLTKKVGIAIRGFFMLGLPTENREESLETISFAKKLDPMWAQFTLTIPYPGTTMFKDLKQNGQIKTFDWNKYNTWSGWKGEDDLPFVPEGRTVSELQSLQKQALREFYMRPAVFLDFQLLLVSYMTLRNISGVSG